MQGNPRAIAPGARRQNLLRIMNGLIDSAKDLTEKYKASNDKYISYIK